jgi:CelD/BcsL family acetyltransferase involved in cellulose biosynthesis
MDVFMPRGFCSMMRLVQARGSSVEKSHHRAGGKKLKFLGLKASVVRSAAEFSALRPVWNDLVHSAQVSMYQTFEWQRTWWEHFGENDPFASLHILVVRDGEVPVGLAPFFVRKVRIPGVASARRLSFIGTGLSDYLDLIIRKGLEFGTVEAIVQHLSREREGWDVAHLEDIPAHSITHKLLFANMKKDLWSGDRLTIQQCPRTRLRGSWRSTLAILTRSQRKSIVMQRRRIEKAFDVVFEVVKNRENLREGLKEFIALHQERWLQYGHLGVCSSPGVAQFLEEAASTCFDRGWLSLTFLRVNGMRVAGSLGFQYGHTYLDYLAGVSSREDILKYSPGQVLIGYCMEEAVERGLQVYDFLRGAEPYKYRFGAADVPNIGLIMFPGSSRVAGRKYGVIQLSQALRKRWDLEWSQLRHQRRTHGLISVRFFIYITQRLKSVLVDGTRKLRSPHSPAYVENDRDRMDTWIRTSRI